MPPEHASLLEHAPAEPTREGLPNEVPQLAFYLGERHAMSREQLISVDAAALEQRTDAVIEQVAARDIWDPEAARGSLKARTEQTSSWNELLRLTLKGIPLETVGRQLKEAIQRAHPHENPERIRQEVERGLLGVEATARVVRGLQRSFANTSAEDAEQTIATNDRLDAEQMVDLVEVVRSGDDVQRVCLIQVRRREVDEDDLAEIHRQHEAFVGTLTTRVAVERETRSRSLNAKAREALTGALEGAESLARGEAVERRVEQLTERFQGLILDLLTEPMEQPVTDHAVDQAVERSGSGIARAELALLLRDTNAWTLFEHCAALDSAEMLQSWQAFKPSYDALRAWAKAYTPSLEELRELTRDRTSPSTALVRGQPIWSIVVHGQQVSTRRLS